MVIRKAAYCKGSKAFKRYRYQLTCWEKDYPHWALETFIKHGFEQDCIVAQSDEGYAVFTEGDELDEF